MKRNLFLLIAFLSVMVQAQSLNGGLDKVLLEQADAMGKTFIAKDYAAFAKYSHPKVTETMGGEKAMIGQLTKDLSEIEADGVKFVGFAYGEPSKIIRVENEMQCTLAQQIIMEVPKGKLTATTTLIALSEDGGKNWFFIDTAGNNINNMKNLIPSLSTDLPVPMPQDPIFEPYEEEAP